MSESYGMKKMPEGLNFEEQLKFIIKENDRSLFYEFISNIDKSLIDKAADIIIEKKNAIFIFIFAKNVKGAPVKKLAKAIIALKKSGYIYLFAKDVENAPIKKLANAIIKTKDSRFIYLFAKDVENAPIKKLANAIIETKDALYIYYFALNVKGAPIQKLAEGIVATQNTKYISLFRKNIDGAPIKYLEEELRKLKSLKPKNHQKQGNIPDILYGNPARILDYALTAPSEQIDELANAMIETKFEWFITDFARYVKGAPIDKLADAVIALEDYLSIGNFMIEVKDAPIDKLLLAYLKLTDIETLCDFIKKNGQYIPFIKIYNALVKNRIWLNLDSLKFLEPSLKEYLEPSLKKYIEEISPPSITKMFELELELDSFYGNEQKYIYKGTFQDDLATKNKLKDKILFDLESQMKRVKRIRKIATESIDKPKINVEQPKRYVRAKIK